MAKKKKTKKAEPEFFDYVTKGMNMMLFFLVLYFGVISVFGIFSFYGVSYGEFTDLVLSGIGTVLLFYVLGMIYFTVEEHLPAGLKL